MILSLCLVLAGPIRPVAAAGVSQCSQITTPFDAVAVGDGGATLRIGCARAAGSLRSLANGDDDVLAAIDFKPGARPDQLHQQMQQFVDTVRADQNPGRPFSAALLMQARRTGVAFYPLAADDIQFGGSIQVVGDSIVIVVPSGDISVAGFWDAFWKKLVTGIIVTAVTVLIAGICLAVFNVGAVAAAPVCGAISGGLAAGVGELVGAALNKKPIDNEVWGAAVAAAIWGAVSGAAAGLLANTLSTTTRELVSSIQATLRGFASRWYASVLEFVRNRVTPDAMAIVRGYLDRLAQGIQAAGALRIMPLGDSITSGTGSSGMNGYRVPLQQRLRDAGVGFDFVGSQSDGVSTADTQHEGHSGWRIDEIAARLPDWLAGYRPQVVTLHLGTNDMIQNYQTAGAVDRLGGVIDQIFAGLPQATVVVSSLVPSRDPAIEARIRAFNQGMSDMVQRRTDSGRHLVFVNMNAVDNGDLADDVHPNDAGYAKMAKVFDVGVLTAIGRDWPVAGSTQNTAVCPPGGNPGGGGPRQARFADLNGDGKDDYLAVDPATGSVRTWLNNGADRDGDHWLPCGITASGTNTGVGFGREMQVADLNADGRDDYLAVDQATGSVRGWLNVRGYEPGDHWDDRGVIASGTNTGVAYGARQVRFGDLNGDGRADYLAVDPANGSVHGWLNNGAENGGDRWIDVGIIASGTNTGVGLTGRQVQFADLNGDGRVEYLAVDQRTGSVHGWLNNGAERGGDRWIDEGIIASGTNTGVGSLGRQAQFADLNGDRLADYVAIDPTTGSTDGWLNVRAWESGDNWLYRGVIASGTNTGVGTTNGVPLVGSFVNGQAAFADLDGDGRDDYLAVNTGNGAVMAWINNGADAAGDHWIGRGTIASGTNTGVGLSGRVVRWADLDGDGRDDYLALDPATGLAEAWINNGAATAGDHWIDRGIIASGTNTGVGLGAGRSEAQFADMNGDGRDDYVAVNQHNGSVHLWLNVGADHAGDRWVDQGVVASGTGTGVHDGGPQVTFADLNGDGFDDYLALDANTGAVHAWLNRGAYTTGDHWEDRGVIASGTGTGVTTRGRRAFLANLNVDRRADYLAVDPSNGSVLGWRNNGADTTGDHWVGLGSIATGNGPNNGAGDGVAA
ncbi:FG-GAP-like repeat-containing protein [Dactylosporangium sp. CA-092794]|uniref:FG-GAP-like repeat-containing protein n=1 Tax=Dactylosporangium sp. CA-092794 TaxID=3239929 RepID=UPI003D8F5965